MTEHSADIIAFPVQPVSPQQQLARALAKLDAALAEQRVVVGQWRASVDALHDELGKLGASASALNASLDDIRGRNAQAHQQAKALEAWADGVLMQDRPA